MNCGIPPQQVKSRPGAGRDRPGNKEGFSFCIDAVEVSRSAMLKTTERQCTRNKEEEITMYYELYLEVKATATKQCFAFHSSIFMTGVCK